MRSVVMSQKNSVTPNVNGDTVLGRVRMWFSEVFSAIRKRFSQAATVFGDRLESERMITQLEKMKAQTKEATVAQLRRAGVLFSQLRPCALNLYEGNNYLVRTENGQFRVSTKLEKNEGESFLLRLDGDSLNVQGAGDTYSNDSVSVGGEPFVLKLLPEEQRIDETVLLVNSEESR